MRVGSVPMCVSSAHLARCCCRRSAKRVPRWRAPVCRLSVWRWHHRGLSRKLGSEVVVLFSFFSKKKDKRGIRRSVRASIQPQRQRERKKRETDRPCECGGRVRVTHVRVYKHREGPLGLRPYSWQGRRASLPVSQQSLTATGVIAEESEANAAEQLAISQNSVIKVFSLMHESKAQHS